MEFDWLKSLFFVWCAFIVIVGFFFDYGATISGKSYAMFQDVHVMTFLAFGMFLTFMARNAFTGVTFALCGGAFIAAWAAANLVFWDFVVQGEGHTWSKGNLMLDHFVMVDYAVLAVLLSFAAIAGRVSSSQMLVIGLIEVIIYTINERVNLRNLGIADVGRTMMVFTFASLFGLAASFVLGKRQAAQPAKPVKTVQSQVLACIGTLFLWCFFPSWNSYMSSSNNVLTQRSVVNTVLALCASTVCAFFTSRLINGKFAMYDVLRSTIAGGIAIAGCANMVVLPAGALSIGTVSGIFSVFASSSISPILEEKLGVHDAAGVFGMAFIPGMIGALANIVCTLLSSSSTYDVAGTKLTNVWSQAGFRNTTSYQVCALLITIGMAAAGGVAAAFVASLVQGIDVFDGDAEFEGHQDEAAHNDDEGRPAEEMSTTD